MNSKYIRTFIFLLVAFAIFRTFQHFVTDRSLLREKNYSGDELEKVKVSVYYEALCPDSRFFITNQLLRTYEDFRDLLILDLVPYGKAVTLEVGGRIEFHCQHDVVECIANKVHACVIEDVKDPLLQLKYVACMITDNMIPMDAGEKCGFELNIDFAPISKCANGDRGSQLLKMYGERTNSLNPKVLFIPTIELNNSRNIVPQSAVLKDLPKSICQVFKNKPKICE